MMFLPWSQEKGMDLGRVLVVVKREFSLDRRARDLDLDDRRREKEGRLAELPFMSAQA